MSLEEFEMDEDFDPDKLEFTDEQLKDMPENNTEKARNAEDQRIRDKKSQKKRTLKKGSKTNDDSLFIRRFPRNLKNHFKAYCAKRGQSMTQALIDILSEAVTKNQSMK